MRLPLAAYDTGAGASGMKTNKQTDITSLIATGAAVIIRSTPVNSGHSCAVAKHFLLYGLQGVQGPF